MSLKFKKIESGDIFTRDFSPLVKNNEITFPGSEEITVIYGPNGTGKTSLIKVLGDTPGTKVEFSFEEAEYQNGSNVFHIINEFNHFEGNLSIFQPAIDITEQSLWKERASLLSFVSTL